MLVLDLSRAWASEGLAPAAVLSQEEGYMVPESCTPPALCQGSLLDSNPKAITVRLRESKIFCRSHGRKQLDRLTALVAPGDMHPQKPQSPRVTHPCHDTQKQ